MKASEVKFTRRFKTGEYEHEEYGVVAQLEDGDSVAGTLVELKSEVVAAFKAEATEKEQNAGKPAKPPKGKKGKKNDRGNATSNSDEESPGDEDSETEDSGNDDQSNQDDEAADSAGSDDADDSSDASASSGDDEESGDSGEDETAAPAKKAKGGVKEVGKKGFRKKPQTYNRSIEQHKEIFSGVLKSVNPDWKKSEASKLKAKQVSQKMEGKPFLDENGETLPEFTSEVKKLMASKK